MSKARIEIGVGTTFYAPFQDGMPKWEVTRSRGRDVWEAVVQGDTTTKIFDSSEIGNRLKMDQAMNRVMSGHEKFYASLKPGQVVHYNNGFRNFVRCVAVVLDNGTKLMPIGLVGNWSPGDLPRLNRNGEPHLSFYVKRIFEKTVIDPTATNIYECELYTEHKAIDPREMPALDLSIPIATPEQLAEVKMWRAVKEAHDLLDQARVNPRAELEAALKIIQGALS